MDVPAACLPSRPALQNPFRLEEALDDELRAQWVIEDFLVDGLLLASQSSHGDEREDVDEGFGVLEAIHELQGGSDVFLRLTRHVSNHRSTDDPMTVVQEPDGLLHHIPVLLRLEREDLARHDLHDHPGARRLDAHLDVAPPPLGHVFRRQGDDLRFCHDGGGGGEIRFQDGPILRQSVHALQQPFQLLWIRRQTPDTVAEEFLGVKADRGRPVLKIQAHLLLDDLHGQGTEG